MGILTIGWCYVLSAQLVEMRGESVSMRYTDLGLGTTMQACHIPRTYMSLMLVRRTRVWLDGGTIYQKEIFGAVVSFPHL